LFDHYIFLFFFNSGNIFSFQCLNTFIQHWKDTEKQIVETKTGLKNGTDDLSIIENSFKQDSSLYEGRKRHPFNTQLKRRNQ
jgi:hypothetical protein